MSKVKFDDLPDCVKEYLVNASFHKASADSFVKMLTDIPVDYEYFTQHTYKDVAGLGDGERCATKRTVNRHFYIWADFDTCAGYLLERHMGEVEVFIFGNLDLYKMRFAAQFKGDLS